MRGRWREWRQAHEALASGHTHLNQLLLVKGPPGSGKTRFLQELGSSATAQGLHWIDLGAAVAGGATWQPAPAPPDQIDAALARVAQSRGGPLLVTVDEPHWSDPDWINQLIVPVPDGPGRVVWAVSTGCHSDSVSPERLPFPGGLVTKIELNPLDHDAIVDLVSDLLHATPSPELIRVVMGAAGIPGMIVDLIHGMLEDGMLRFEAGEATVAREALPRRIHDSVRRQLARVGARGRQVVQIAAALGTSFSLIELTDLMSVSVAGLMPAIEEAMLAGLVRCSKSDLLSFCSDLSRRAILETIPLPLRMALHRDVTRLRERSPESLPGKQSTLTTMEWAPSPTVDPTVATIERCLASGQLRTAIGHARDALATRHHPALVTAELQGMLAEALIFAGDPMQAATMASQLMSDSGLPPRMRENAQAARLLALSLCDHERAWMEAREIVDGPAARAGDATIAMAATVLSNACWDKGELAQGLTLARGAVAHISATTMVRWRPHVRLALARKLADCRILAEAEQIIDKTEAEIQEFGARLHVASVHLARARVHARTGCFTASKAEATIAITLARESGSELLVPLANATLATAALRNGDLLTAAEHVQRCRESFAVGIRPLWSAQYDWVELLLVAERDGPRLAARLLSERYEQILSRQLLFIEEPGAAAWLVRLSRLASEPAFGHAAITTVTHLANGNPDFPGLRVGAVHAKGLANCDSSALETALRDHADPWAAAMAAEDLGQLLMLGCAHTKEVITHLETALQRFEAIGAERDAARIRMRLRSMGVRRRKPGSAPVGTDSGWSSLVDVERTIIYLVQLGLTNRQIASRIFLSQHTVNYYLRQIFKKLGIHSRVQLAQLAQAHLPPDSAE